MRYCIAVCVLLLSAVAQAENCGRKHRAVNCPYCDVAGLTLTEQVGEQAAAVLASWSGGVKPDPKKEGDVGVTKYKIEEILKAPKEGLAKGDEITLPIWRPKSDDLVLLFATKNISLKWETPIPVTETAFGYLKNAPSPEVRPQSKRLLYFLKFLEFPDEVIANDAYGEFGRADYKDIAALSPKMNRERLRKWLADSNTSANRYGLYGLMLGMCGKPEDAGFLKRIIENPTDAQELGIDGVMHGYLLLSGETGLEYLEETKFKPKWKRGPDGKPVVNAEGNKIPFPFAHKYNALQAIRNQWQFGNDKLTRDRLKTSLRICYRHNPDLAEFVIENLSRWEDWEMMPEIVKAFDRFERVSVKRACVRFMFAARDSKAKTEADKKRVESAKKHLAAMRAAEKDLVDRIERFEFRRRGE